MRRPTLLVVLALSVVTGSIGCSGAAADEVTLHEFPISSIEGILTRSGVEFDEETTSDGNGSLRLVATEPTTFRLYELADIDVEDTRLTYRARIRTEGVQGQVYLEMWCRFPGRGEFFSRALHAPISGTVEWTTQETPFLLEPGQNPDNIKLNIVLDGTGTVWIDDVVLARAGQ